MSDIRVIVQYTAQPGKAEPALMAITALVQAVLSTEPDCGGIQILQNQTEPERITLVERWPNREIFLGPHMQQPHIRAFIECAGELLAGPPDISFHAVVEGESA